MPVTSITISTPVTAALIELSCSNLSGGLTSTAPGNFDFDYPLALPYETFNFVASYGPTDTDLSGTSVTVNIPGSSLNIIIEDYTTDATTEQANLAYFSIVSDTKSGSVTLQRTDP
jgi:hypothetical protein